MANNNVLFNAAVSGAISGVSSRWLTTAAAGTYATLKTAIVAFATALDTAIPAEVGGATEGQAGIIQTIATAFWKDRVQTKTLAADYTSDVVPLASLYQTMKTALLAGSGAAFNIFPVVINDDDGTVAAQTVVTHQLAAAGIVAATDKVMGMFVGGAIAPGSGLLFLGGIPADNFVSVNYVNPTAGPVTNGAQNYTWFIARTL